VTLALRLALALAALCVSAAPAAAKPKPGAWYAGDGHVHTCYSHDSYCPPDDDNTGPETFYSSFGSVEQRFSEAAAKGLDFLTISDHNDVRAWSDPAFGTHGVIGMHAFEASLQGGHAHAIGVSKLHDRPGGATPELAAAAANGFAAAVEEDGGLFQANHPSEKLDRPLGGCQDFELDQWEETPMSWRYGFSVRPGMIEVWNPTTMLQPSELFWECWLQRGHRVPAGAGSDSHGGNMLNLGSPTLWVFAKERSEASILKAMKAGRTTITRRPPIEGEMRLLLEGEKGAMVGDTVEPGSKLRVRVEGLPGLGWVRVRANGATLVERAPILPGGVVEVSAPEEGGWVRASLLMTERSFGDVDPNCTPNPLSAESPYALCSDDQVVAAMTSPIYVEGAEAPAKPKTPKKAMPRKKPKSQGHDEHDHVDMSGIPAARHSGSGSRLPRVPAVRRARETLRR
jgi:hypothetical protein